ncbi:AAA family ATPase [Paractinoplanes brasiliensis]|uniref:Transitional endoplasmic reticulum ATPase n=1 Tax=Paractinoplanes brasiliensis TaxID=52695 RepID=A0A4R6JTS7_9ACTN|nr:AAA family ATPase [Actinoplanes brasiliensis]TDO39939.1 transitional endoplasmic reticulum ATPase [Actinoplanes brasiliensis]GID31561.1 ATPase [Actinoplanes brasiliensis]
MTDELTLTATLRPTGLDDRRGIVRLHPDVMTALSINAGDPVRLSATRTTAALAAKAQPGASREFLYADDLTLGNLGLRDGGRVTVCRQPAVAARHVVLAGAADVVALVSPEMLRLALLGKVVTEGDNVSLRPQELMPVAGPDIGQSLRNRLGYQWNTALLTVIETDGALITMDTVVGWQDGPVSSPVPGPSVRPEAPAATDPEVPPPSLDDLPGMRAQAKELEELLDLGFNHKEVLERLGTEVSLGVLITGPAGSGKSALVRAVAAQVGARVLPVWAPEIAALTNQSAAARLRELAREARTGEPTVVLFSDADSLAPREEPGPISVIFHQVVEETVRAGVAVIATTSRPESVDPSLRAPHLLATQLAVPLPDAAMRREQLGVLTRSLQLAEDVRLDEIAGRTPGFVAADLGALAREAGVRAALRQKDGDVEKPTVAMADFEAALDVVRPTSMAESTLEVAAVTLDEVGDMAEVKQVLTESVLWPLNYPDTFARLGVSPPRGVLLYGPPGCGKTFLVKAIAGTGKANVLSVKGAELLSKWVGDSERAVRELFRRARDAAPTLVFLDEVDALAPTRGQGTDGGTTDRVVASLLTELDGVEDLRNVVVIGATNRPDLIDPALLRPGRLERLVYVPPPDAEARAAILKASSKSVPLDESVDLAALGAELEGFSAADCAALIRESALAAMRDSLEASTVTAANVATARTRVRASLDPGQVAWLAAYAETHQP